MEYLVFPIWKTKIKYVSTNRTISRLVNNNNINLLFAILSLNSKLCTQNLNQSFVEALISLPEIVTRLDGNIMHWNSRHRNRFKSSSCSANSIFSSKDFRECWLWVAACFFWEMSTKLQWNGGTAWNSPQIGKRGTFLQLPVPSNFINVSWRDFIYVCVLLLLLFSSQLIAQQSAKSCVACTRATTLPFCEGVVSLSRRTLQLTDKQNNLMLVCFWNSCVNFSQYLLNLYCLRPC